MSSSSYPIALSRPPILTELWKHYSAKLNTLLIGYPFMSYLKNSFSLETAKIENKIFAIYIIIVSKVFANNPSLLSNWNKVTQAQ
jgi:hypothetical protein